MGGGSTHVAAVGNRHAGQEDGGRPDDAEGHDHKGLDTAPARQAADGGGLAVAQETSSSAIGDGAVEDKVDIRREGLFHRSSFCCIVR